MILFKIGEGKMTERSLKKQIEQMEMDNYLINIDVLRMKNQLDAYKSQRKRKISSTTNQNLEFHLNFSNDDIEPIKEENNEDENENKN